MPSLIGRAVVLASVCFLFASSAEAQSVEDARRHYLEAEFEEAVADFESILSRPSLDAAVAVECHSHLMVMRLLLGDPDAARVHASYALALDPAASAPAGAPPEAAELLSEVRSEVSGGTRLTIDALTTPEEGEPTSFIASLDTAPDGLFETIRLRCASGDNTAEDDGAPPSVELSLLPEDEVFCRASASTAGGAVLLRARESFALGQDAAGEEGGGGTSPWVWVGVGAGVLAVAAAVVAVVLIVPNDQAMLGPPVIE